MADVPGVTADVDQLRWREGLALCVLALLCLGVLAVESAAANVGRPEALDLLRWTPHGTRQVMFAVLAAAAFFVGSRLDVAAIGRSWLPPAALALAVAACAAVLVPGVGEEVNGARRWLPVGPVRVQASELAKWAAVLWLAWRATRGGLDSWRKLLLACGPLSAACLLVVIEDFGTAALIGLAAFTVLLVGGAKVWQLGLLAVPALAAGAWFVAGTPYRWARLTGFLDPWADARGTGFHMTQSLASFASGGPAGAGLGNGVQKQGFLPEDTTDFIFAVIGEELGLAGALGVVGLYVAVLACGWHAVRHGRDPFARLLAFGVTTTVGLQAAINLAVATVSVPTKGMPLPLVSYGGSGLVLTGLMLGLLCATIPGEKTEDRRQRTGRNGDDASSAGGPAPA